MSCQRVCMNSPQIICHLWREFFIEDSQPSLTLEKNASKEHIAHGHTAFAKSRLNFDAELNGAFRRMWLIPVSGTANTAAAVKGLRPLRCLLRKPLTATS